MHWYQTALICFAAIAAITAWNVPRAVFWLALGVLSFVLSSMWHDAGLPYGAAFGAATNLAVCFAIYALAELKYEMRVWNCFHLMILLDILYLTEVITSHWMFAVSLELANWLAMTVIFTAGVMERVNGLPPRRSRLGRAGYFAFALYGQRDTPPFWKA